MLDRVVGPHAAAVEELDVDGDVVLFNGATNRVLVLNGPASEAWRLADGSCDVDALVHALAIAHGTDPEHIRNQVIDLVESLRSEGFLQ